MFYKLNLRNEIKKAKNNFIHLSQMKKEYYKLIKKIRNLKEKKIILLYITGIIFYCISLTHLSVLV